MEEYFGVMRKCSNCKRELELTQNFYKDKSHSKNHVYRCKDCQVIMRFRNQTHRIKWNHEHRESLNKAVANYMLRNPEKKKAWSIWRRAVSSGKIVKQACVICADPIAQGHHKDYSKPLEVVWLCRRHHKDAHAGRITV